uniref:Acrosin n=1 Tax=Catharus ustulatus TaxID=91951 RepID=A0A8C3V546_CATUS
MAGTPPSGPAAPSPSAQPGLGHCQGSRGSHSCSGNCSPGRNCCPGSQPALGQAGAWRGIASIQVTWENGTWHMCTGVLLSPQWVLTVAHCFMSPETYSTWDVVMGASDLTHPGPEAAVRHIKKLLMHEHYVPATARNDIALLELDQPLDNMTLEAKPGPGKGRGWVPSCWGLIPMVLGPGLTLQEAKVHLMDTELCNSSRWYAGAVRADDLCAGYPHGGIDTCQGDSGSPLVCKDNGADSFWLVGMYSWGRGCDRARHPGIYTDTQYFHNWILHHTGAEGRGGAGGATLSCCCHPGLSPCHQRCLWAGTPSLSPLCPRLRPSGIGLG